MMKIRLTFFILIFGILSCQAQNWSWSEDFFYYPREGLSATVLDDSIFFSGGRAFGSCYNQVEVYDVGENVWSTTEPLSSGRFQTSSASAGGMVFIAGGSILPVTTYFSEVDIYNKETAEWTVEYLSEPRTFIAAVAHGNKVFFAGGARGTVSSVTYCDVVDIYNTESGTWSTETLSVERCMIGAATSGNKIFFAGGTSIENEVTDVVDIYDTFSGEWTVEYLSEPRAAIGAVSYGNKVYFAGGAFPDGISSDRVDIYNVDDEEWEEIQTLSEPRIVTAQNVYDALIFTGEVDYLILSTWIWGVPNGVVDVYYPDSNQWDYSVPPINPPRMWYGYAAYNNKAYYAGGWSIEMEESYTVNILEYENPISDISKDKIRNIAVEVYPNPCKGNCRIDYYLLHPDNVNITIYNNIGVKVDVLLNEYKQAGRQQMIYNAEKLVPGIYFFVLNSSYGSHVKKLIKQ